MFWWNKWRPAAKKLECFVVVEWSGWFRLYNDGAEALRYDRWICIVIPTGWKRGVCAFNAGCYAVIALHGASSMLGNFPKTMYHPRICPIDKSYESRFATYSLHWKVFPTYFFWSYSCTKNPINHATWKSVHALCRHIRISTTGMSKFA
jgi:hypothetical protein